MGSAGAAGLASRSRTGWARRAAPTWAVAGACYIGVAALRAGNAPRTPILNGRPRLSARPPPCPIAPARSPSLLGRCRFFWDRDRTSAPSFVFEQPLSALRRGRDGLGGYLAEISPCRRAEYLPDLRLTAELIADLIRR